MSKIKSPLDEDFNDDGTEREFTRYSSDPAFPAAFPIKGKLRKEVTDAFKKAEAKKEKETLPVAASRPSNDIQVWYRNLTLRTHLEPDKSKWFCLADACKALGFKDAEQARKSHCLGETISHKPENSAKKICYVGESDLYNLILRSNVAGAVPFRKFVTEKVLPVLRENGRYVMPEDLKEEYRKEAASLKPIAGEQLELFPITAKASLTFPPSAIDILQAARKKFLEEKTEFESYSAFLGHLIEIGLDRIGFHDFTLTRNGGR